MTPSRTLQPGAHVGGLQINEILGIGAFAVTYLVTDPAIGTRFALKEYLPRQHAVRDDGGKVVAIDDESAQAFSTGLDVFLNEARIVAALEHPNIVQVLRYFEANGTAYYLMPYYRGQALHLRIESRGVLDRDAAKALFLPLMDALEYLHLQGIVHQDVKPANIYMTDNGQPVLLDFGVAAAGNILPDTFGSEGYSAPEQSVVDGNIGPWTDVYGLAATMYRCVTGRVPVPATERQEALRNGGEDPLVAFRNSVPTSRFGGLTDAVDLGLQLAARDRPQSVGQWRKSFEGLEWHREVVAKGGARDYARDGREWLPMALLTVFIATMLAIGAYLLFVEPSEDISAGVPDSTGPVSQSVAPPYRPLPEELERWQAALEADTLLAYRRFMEDFPESMYLEQAQTQLDILDEANWQELSAEDSIPAYEDYLELFPDGIHQAQALQRIDAIERDAARQKRERLERERLDNLAWQTAIDERTLASLDTYISDFPAGLHIEEANRVRRLLQAQADDDKAFDAARNLNTLDAYQAYVDAFPKGANVTAALQRMDDLTLRPGKTFRDCAVCPAMIVVPSGTYWQGSDESSELALAVEKPRRMVTIGKPFAVGIHEITMAEWDACFEAGGCTSSPTDNGWGRGDRPVIMVSWTDAGEYLQWLNDKAGQHYRLPSESEWEYVARAGEEGDWPGGAESRICEFGNIAGAETGFRWQHETCNDGLALGTAPAGSFRANAFGLYDTTGNVSEWTADCMNLSYLDAPVDGSAWGRGICSSHMTRGGSWITGSREIRLPARFNLKNGDRNDFTGFRVVREIEE
ncbi:MAG: bifunctional serine/threonine-protein kinase/formylglycine-generating enzyme family protein [Xanthomonadales bacterium]|nr:bifunctional serine/threonine-protein kinase/formylglycine-generating enzyme family protein [Xanthomonadales bacterium]